MNKKGLIYLFEGEGKGKTSAALGVTMRALVNDWRVVWLSFIKEESWDISEKKLRDKFENLEMYFVGKGFYIKNVKLKMQNAKLQFKAQKLKTGVIVDKAEEKEHKMAAEEGLELVKEKLVSGKYQLVVMDEINNAVSEGLLSEEEVIKVIEQRDQTYVVLTGRLGEKTKLRDLADLVTECRKIKHPYDRGVVAVKGLDY